MFPAQKILLSAAKNEMCARLVFNHYILLNNIFKHHLYHFEGCAHLIWQFYQNSIFLIFINLSLLNFNYL